MHILILELWDCHYELMDSYITSAFVQLKGKDIFIDVANSVNRRIEDQILLKNKYSNIHVKQIKMNEIFEKKYEYVIINTTHVHGSSESASKSMGIINKLKPENMAIICHNHYDTDFADRIKLKCKVKRVFLSKDCQTYYNLNNYEDGKSCVYDAFSDYGEYICKRQKVSDHRLNLVINGMLREGKGFRFVKEIAIECGNLVNINVVGSGHKNIVRRSGLYNCIRNGYINNTFITNERSNQKQYIEEISRNDALLDLKPYPSHLIIRESTSGNLQLSRSLNIPIISHINSYPNEYSIRFNEIKTLCTMIQNGTLERAIIDERTRLMKAKNTNNLYI